MKRGRGGKRAGEEKGQEGRRLGPQDRRMSPVHETCSSTRDDQEGCD